jgi:hypothetical protein
MRAEMEIQGEISTRGGTGPIRTRQRSGSPMDGRQKQQHANSGLETGTDIKTTGVQNGRAD